MTKLEDALRLRDLALALLRQHGRLTQAGSVKMLSAEVGKIQLGLRTPFQAVPASAVDKYTRALVEGAPDDPYSLDIWAPKKVLFLTWGNGDAVHLGSFRRGPWEEELIHLAGQLSA